MQGNYCMYLYDVLWHSSGKSYNKRETINHQASKMTINTAKRDDGPRA